MNTQYLDGASLRNTNIKHPSTNPNGLEMPYLCCSYGPKRSGKTTNAILEMREEAKNIDIVKVYVITTTRHSNEELWRQIPCEIEFCENPYNTEGFLTKIIKQREYYVEFFKKMHDAHPTIQSFKKYVRKKIKEQMKLEKMVKEEMGTIGILGLKARKAAKILDNMFPEMDEERKEEDPLQQYQDLILDQVTKYGVERMYNKPLFITLAVDDMQDMPVFISKTDNPFKNFVYVHRHIRANLWAMGHSIKGSLARSHRINITRMFFHRFKDEDTIEDIRKLAYSHEADKKTFHTVYNKLFSFPQVWFTQIDSESGECRINWGVIYKDAEALFIDILSPGFSPPIPKKSREENELKEEESKLDKKDMQQKDKKRKLLEYTEQYKEKDDTNEQQLHKHNNKKPKRK